MKFKLFIGMYCCFLSLSSSALDIETKDLIRVPVRIHITASPSIPHLDASVSNKEINLVFENVNLIWKQAKIEFYIESVVKHIANAEQLYLLASDKSSELSDKERKVTMRKVCDITPWSNSVLNLCIVGRMSGSRGGVAYKFKKRSPLVVWPLELKRKKNHNPATLAHEFGHFLGLRHNTEKDIYLMRGAGNNIRRVGKTDKIKLTSNEVKHSRNTAKKFTP